LSISTFSGSNDLGKTRKRKIVRECPRKTKQEKTTTSKEKIDVLTGYKGHSRHEISEKTNHNIIFAHRTFNKQETTIMDPRQNKQQLKKY
jgi:hypothetical protein